MRGLELMWFENVIVVKSVTDTRVGRDIGAGYTLKSICTFYEVVAILRSVLWR